MRYLIVDGMPSGTGIRDATEGGYLSLHDLGLSPEFIKEMSNWLHHYESAHHTQYSNKHEVAALDMQGLMFCKKIQEQIPQSKIEYFSDAEMRKIQFE